MIELAEADGALHAGRHDPRAVVGQHRHRARAGRQAARLPAARRDARERVDRAPPAARDLRRRDHAVAGRGGEQRRDPAGREDRAPTTPSYVLLFQYGNPANPLAHYEGTGPEIWRDCPEVDVFVAGLGTSGTLMGVGRYLKEQKPARAGRRGRAARRASSCRGCATSTTGSCRRSSTPTVLDRKFIVRPRESIEWTRRLLDECGVFAGHLVGRGGRGRGEDGRRRWTRARSSTLLPDGGWKYLSSGAWTDRPRRGRRARHAHQLLVTRPTSPRHRRRASRVLRRGGLVAFPTETVYGLGADAANADARAPPLRGEGPPGRPSR